MERSMMRKMKPHPSGHLIEALPASSMASRGQYRFIAAYSGIEDSEQPAMSSEDANPETTFSEDSEQPNISSEDSNPHNTTALSLITDRHIFLATASNTPLA